MLKTRLDLMVENDRKLYEQNQLRADLLAKRNGMAAKLGGKVSGVRLGTESARPDQAAALQACAPPWLLPMTAVRVASTIPA